MRKLALIAAMILPAALIAGAAYAFAPARAVSAEVLASPGPSSELQLDLLMNGNCSGTNAQDLQSTGTSASLSNLVDGAVYSMSCDAAVHWRQGSSVTVSFTATPTTFGEKLAASPDKVRWVQHGSNLSIISVTGTANCVPIRCQ